MYGVGTAPSFPVVQTTVAPPPSAFWGSNLKAPLPTNAPWQNFVLNRGTAPEVVSPYIVRSADGRIEFGSPSRDVQTGFILQVFISNIILTTLEGLSSHVVESFDDLSVTLAWTSSSSGQQTIAMPLVRGSPYLTFIFRSPSTPIFSTIHAVTGRTSSRGNTKHKLMFNNGQTWLVYASGPLDLDASLRATSPFTGTIRVALLPNNSPAREEAILDRHAPVFPLGGTISLRSYAINYYWNASSWSSSLSADDLLMLTTPVHRQLQAASSPTTSPSPTPNPCTATPTTSRTAARKAAETVPPAAVNASWLVHSTIDGNAIGRVGAVWRFKVNAFPVQWHSGDGLDDASANDIAALKSALQQDVASLMPTSTGSSYFYGKAAARAARLILIAEELDMDEQAAAAAAFVEQALTPWLDGTFGGNAFLYDPTWGGLVTRAGAADSGADFGTGMYNDHHFHYGYFLYASAVLARRNLRWARQYKSKIFALVRDFMSPERDTSFPRLRQFDAYALHSWASGLFEFGDGRNQESSSEAINAYYAASLVGLAYSDIRTASLGATLAALETVATQTLWHIPERSTVYPSLYRASNRILGMAWANKRDSALWFAPATDLDKRLGIQVLPVTPYTRNIFRNKAYARQLIDWAAPVLQQAAVTDGWRGFAWAVQAIYDPSGATAKIEALSGFDDGNSKSNLLWFALSQ